MKKQKQENLTEEERAERKAKRKKRTIRALAIVLSVLAAIVIPVTVLVSVHSYEPDSYGSKWSKTDAFSLSSHTQALVVDAEAETLKILQLADPQIKFGFMTADTETMDLIGLAIDKLSPDVCVVTGDLTLSVNTYYAYKYFADFMEKKKCYWALAFGNHDDEFDASKYRLGELLAKYEYCLFDYGPASVKGHSNYVVSVYAGSETEENFRYGLVMLDSGTYPQEREGMDMVYDWIGSDQVEWYEWQIKGMQSVKENVKTSAFFHMPLKQYAEMYYADAVAKDPDATMNDGTENADKKIADVLDLTAFETVSSVSGTVCERAKKKSEYVPVRDENEKIVKENGKTVYDPYTVGIYYQGNDTGLFAKAQALGSTHAMFCGHDHANTLRGKYGGIYLAYGRCCGYHTYPFFREGDALLGLFDRNDVYYNGALWQDENGDALDKGVTLIEVEIGSSYGGLHVEDYGHGKLRQM